MKKIIIFILALIFLIITLAFWFVFNQALEFEKKANDLTAYYSNQNCLPGSIEELIAENDSNLINLTNYIIFASAENFKKGTPSDLPKGFLFYPGTDLNQVFSFPYPYERLLNMPRGLLFPFNDDPDKITDFYLKMAHDNDWEITGDEQNSKSRLMIFSDKANTRRIIFVFRVINSLDEFIILPADLNIEGQSLIIFKYVLENKSIDNESADSL